MCLKSAQFLETPEERCIRCGKFGCLENVASYDAMKRSTDLSRLSHGDFEKDPRGRQKLLQTAPYVGAGLAPLAVSVNPQLVVLGGPAPDMYSDLIPQIEAGIEEAGLQAIRRDLSIRLDRDAKDSVVHGATIQLLQQEAPSFLSNTKT